MVKTILWKSFQSFMCNLREKWEINLTIWHTFITSSCGCLQSLWNWKYLRATILELGERLMRSRVRIMKEIHKLYAMLLVLSFYNKGRGMFVNADDENYFVFYFSIKFSKTCQNFNKHWDHFLFNIDFQVLDTISFKFLNCL